LQDEAIAWHNALFGQNGTITLNYIDTVGAGFQARQDFIAGNVDFAISGVPFQPGELAQLPGGASDVIAAPVFVSAVGALLALPAWGVAPGTQGSPAGQTGFPGLQIQTPQLYCFDTSSDVPPSCANDPTCLNFQTLNNEGIGENCANVDLPYTGPINVPAEELASMIFHPTGETRILWQNPAIESAFSVPSGDLLNPIETPTAILQSQPSELDYYAQTFAATAAPDVWAEVLNMAGEPAGTPISEAVPTQVIASDVKTKVVQGIATARAAVDRPLDQYAADLTATGAPDTFALLPPEALHDALAEAPDAAVQWIAVPNAAGQYVTPSPASIDAAVNVGGDIPLYALSHSVAGAYPLVYVDDLYVKAHGLSLGQTDAMAAMIRYMATAGQEQTAQFGDGRLAPGQVTEALNAANQEVDSNCTGKGQIVVTSTNPGRYMPAFAAGSVEAQDIAAIGPMDQCETHSTKHSLH
jgi:hypothetical protein